MILQFKQKPIKGAQPRMLNLPRWHCLHCGSDVFRLYETGNINCAGCHRLIRGISVEKT